MTKPKSKPASKAVKSSTSRATRWPDQITDRGEVEIRNGAVILRGGLADDMTKTGKSQGISLKQALIKALRNSSWLTARRREWRWQRETSI
jgi:hypothetical protein